MTPPADPHGEYALRLADLRAAQVRLERQRAWAGNARFALLFAVPVIVIILAVFRSLSPAWLLEPAMPEGIVRRQEAVRELAGRPAWRERLALAGDDLPAGLDTAAVAAWGAAATDPPAARTRWAANGIVAASLAGLAGWG